MPSDVMYIYSSKNWADTPRVRTTDIETPRLGREAMLRNNRRDVAGNRSLPTREEEDDDDEVMAIKVLGNGEFDVGGRRVMFDKDDDGEMVVRRKGGKEMGGEDDTKSTFTSSTGQRSQLGATWRGSMDQTMNTGFGSSTRRTMNGRGVREGREREVRTSSMHGVGRTAKGPAAVPLGLSRAALGKLGAVTDEDEDGSDSGMSTTVEYQGRSGVDETTAEKRQRLRRDRVTRSSTVQVFQPKRAASGRLGAVADEDEDGSDSDMSTTVVYQGRSGVDETTAERRQRLRRDRETRSSTVQVSQPKTKKSVKFADKDGTTIKGTEIRRKKTKEKEEEGSWMSKWRPKLTWFV